MLDDMSSRFARMIVTRRPHTTSSGRDQLYLDIIFDLRMFGLSYLDHRLDIVSAISSIVVVIGIFPFAEVSGT
jgi:hypothetical protein